MARFNDLARLDGVAQAGLVARGEVTASELLEACAERLDALNPLINALPVVDLDRGRARPVKAGPFAGVPFAVKDVTPYPGLRCSFGARLFSSYVVQEPTPYTTRLDAGGLVTIGKTATSEFGLLGSTETFLDGVTHNPWDLSLSAAGSSGGAAAAVAAGLLPLAHASDGGGSIRIPASVNGLFGLMPSRGRCVPASMGPSDFGALVGEHCVSRSVRDSALLLSLTESKDSAFAPLGFVREPIRRSLRIATWTRTMTGEEPDASVRRAYDDAVSLCVSLGHQVEPVEAPALDGAKLGDGFFLMAGATVAGAVGMMTQMHGAPVQRRELEPFTWALAEEFQRRGPTAIEQARVDFAAATQQYLSALRGFDVVLTPTLATAPWRLGHLSPILPREELLRRTARAVGYTPIHNIAGCPAMSVPLHWTEDGHPIGIHFAAAPGADALLLGLAYQLEEARPWKDRWAPYSYPRLFAN